MKTQKTKIVSIKARFLDSEKEIELGPKGNRCFFFKPIEHKEKIIQLRLDFNKTLSKDPVLDADFYKCYPICGKNLIKNERFHHTHKEYHEDQKEFYYKFEFDGLEINVNFNKNVLESFSDKIVFSDSLNINHIRDGKIIRKHNNGVIIK